MYYTTSMISRSNEKVGKTTTLKKCKLHKNKQRKKAKQKRKETTTTTTAIQLKKGKRHNNEPTVEKNYNNKEKKILQ